MCTINGMTFRAPPCMIKNVYWYSCPILMKLEFSLMILEKNEISNFMKIRPVGDEVFRAGGRTDITKLIVAFRNFANAPKNVPLISVWEI